ncbi:hypothetical protein [Haloarchaeobius sp. TZWSO28]|uniref:hypothetical protein n=1 Tax=Haloarchaeobius sp. TZWSO28 TaxID=3446119 RepID=UPI003EB9EBC5
MADETADVDIEMPTLWGYTTTSLEHRGVREPPLCYIQVLGGLNFYRSNWVGFDNADAPHWEDWGTERMKTELKRLVNQLLLLETEGA